MLSTYRKTVSREIQTYTTCWSRSFASLVVSDGRCGENVWGINIFHVVMSTPSFGGEVKPSVPCRKFAACKISVNGVEVVISAKLPDNILAHSSTFRH
jgi:hypothetical protein